MSPETTALRGEAAALIREHLWQSKVSPASPDKRPWTMGRELNIWKLLVKTFAPEDINGAITVVRILRPDWFGRRLSLRIFYWKTKDGFNSTPFLETCIGYHHKNQGQDRKHKARLPDSVRSVLRDMAR